MTYFLIGLIVVLLSIVIYLIFGKKDRGLNEGMKEIKKEIAEMREKNIETLQTQLKEGHNIRKETYGLIKDVSTKLERLHSDHQHVKDVKQQLGKLTDVLANPKQRGILGEYFLETLLKKCFSAKSIQASV